MEKEKKNEFHLPEYYENRELSWLKFDARVLNEAKDKSIPLLERLKFVSITSSNLDEFFMVRVASLKDMVHADYRKRDIAGMTASEQLDRINTATRKLVESQYNTYNRSLVPLMAANGIHIIEKYEELTAEQAAYVDRYFEEDVYPVLTPMAVDASRPFPLIRNKTLNIAALLSSKKDEKHKDAVEFATVQVPGVLPRLVPIPADTSENSGEVEGRTFILLEQIIEKNIDKIDRNGDGVIGYVLAIGDIGHNDSIARTRGVRSALGTGVDADGAVDSTPAGTNVDGSAKVVQDAKLDVDGKTYTIRELASQEMKNSAGATWDAATAGNAIGTWTASFGDQIDVVVSNNDGMGMSMFNAWAKDNKVPTFGYDANSDAVAAIAEGYGGTISQHADVQAYLTLRVLRNALDGVDVDTGIGTADEAGNCLTEGEDYRYSEEERSYYALNVAVTAENYQDFTDSTKVYDKVSKQLDSSKSPTKKVWLDIYNASDNFLSSTYQPLLENYDDLLNLKVDYIGGDGQTESNITNRLGNPGEYDAFAINMVKTDNAASYTTLLNK